MPVRPLVAALGVQLALGAGLIAVVGREARATGGPTVNRFDASRAFAEARYEVSLGPRPAGSPVSRRLAEHLRRLLPHGRFEAVPGGLRNVVGSLPGRRPAIVVGAHYDTKRLGGFVGANDGAAGSAVLVELARVMSHLTRRPGAPELRFVAFDGEESPIATPETPRAFVLTGLRGSRAYVRAHRGEVGRMVLVDFVGQRGLSLPREGGSDPALWARLRAAARRVGVAGAFPDRTRPRIYDDHTPFTGAGIPSIDLIDFDYPAFHTRADTLDKLSPRSLDVAGESVAELLRTL